MTDKPKHCEWFTDTNAVLQTQDGIEVPVWKFEAQDDTEIMKEWALHFRRSYCSDEELAEMSKLHGVDSSDYLKQFVMPSKENYSGCI